MYWLWYEICLHEDLFCFNCIPGLNRFKRFINSYSSGFLRNNLSSLGARQPLQWRHNERDDVSNHRLLVCFFSRFFRLTSKTTLCYWPVTDGFPSQKASNAETVPIWWRYHGHFFLGKLAHIHLVVSIVSNGDNAVPNHAALIQVM